MATCSHINDHFTLPEAIPCKSVTSVKCSECPARMCAAHVAKCSECAAPLCQRHRHEWVIGIGRTQQLGVWCGPHELVDRMAMR